MTEIRGQSQVPSQHASFLDKNSVAGRRIKFVETSNFGFGSFTVAAGGFYVVNFTLTLYPPEVPTGSRTNDMIIQPSDAFCVAYNDIYVDYDNNGNYYYLSGPSITSEQSLSMIYTQNESSTPYVDNPIRYTATVQQIIQNWGASSHTYYMYGLYKYMILGDVVS